MNAPNGPAQWGETLPEECQRETPRGRGIRAGMTTHTSTQAASLMKKSRDRGNINIRDARKESS